VANRRKRLIGKTESSVFIPEIPSIISNRRQRKSLALRTELANFVQEIRRFERSAE
jgi:hypothetical protein